MRTLWSEEEMRKRYIQKLCLEFGCDETVVLDKPSEIFETPVFLLTPAELEAERRKAFEAARLCTITREGGDVQPGIYMSVCGKVARCEWSHEEFADYLKTVEGEE